MVIDAAFSKVLRQLRTERGFSQESFAGSVGIHRTYVSQLERGLKSPSLHTIQSIARSLDISLSELMMLLEEEMYRKDKVSV